MENYIFLSELFTLLNDNSTYAVLRNYDKLPEDSGRDIDILISKQDLSKILQPFFLLLEKYGFKILLSDKRQFMHFVVIGRVFRNQIELISFDFVYHLHVRGIKLISTEEVLKTRQYNGRIYHVRKDYEFLSKYIYNKLLNVEFPAKYAAVEEQAISQYSKEINQTLQDVFGSKISNLDDILLYDSYAAGKLFRSRQKKKHCVEYYKDQLVFVFTQLKRYFVPNGLSIAFTGPDGVGKTTVINMIMEKLEQVSTVTLFHHRPSLIGNLSNVAHQVGLKKEVDDDYANPHRGKKNNVFSSLLRLLYYSVDYILGYLLRVHKHLVSGGFVIFDRYYSDIIVDSQRSSVYLSYSFLYRFGALFIPKLNYNILLTANYRTILNRKRELDEKSILLINEKIDYLADKKGYKKFLNEQEPEMMVAQIFDYIFENQHVKNKRLFNL